MGLGLRNDGARFLMHHLSTLKIDDPDLYKERAPITEDMRELAKLSEHPIYKWLDLHREAETGPFRREVDLLNLEFLILWL